MQKISPDPDAGRYIIRAGDPARLAEIINAIRDDPDIELVDVIGPAAQPHTAVALMPHAAARALDQRFRASHNLTIEPDRPLSLFGGM